MAKYDGYDEGCRDEFDKNDSLTVCNKYNNTVVVPMRCGSKGVKDKNIKDFSTLPLYYWTLKKLYNLMQMKKVDNVIVSSDNDWYLDKVSTSFRPFSDFKLVLSKRPEELSMDSTTTDEVVLHEINKHVVYAGLVSIVEVTSPLIPVDSLNQMISVIDDFVDSSFIVCKEVGQFWKCDRPDYRWEAQYKKRDMRQVESYPLFKEAGAWCTKVEKFRESKDRISGSLMPIIVDKEFAISINDENDFKYAEMLVKDLAPTIFKNAGFYR